MTSGNRSDEPITIEEKYLEEKLSPIADYFLTNDRPIHNRCDDSIVLNLSGSNNIFIRKSRGFVPEPVKFTTPHLILSPTGRGKLALLLRLFLPREPG